MLPLLHQPIPQLDRIDLVTVRLPFVSPFGTSVHVWTCKEALLLRIEGAGHTAWAECVADPDPFYSPETTTSCRHIIKEYLLPLLKPGMTVGEMEAAFRPVRGNGMARATVENAVLTLLALAEAKPLHALLGYPARRIMSGISIGLKESPAALVAAVEEAVGRGYHRGKRKIKKGKDIAYVDAVRTAFPDLRLMVDANGDYALSDASHLRQLDAFGLMMIEQPLSYSDIAEHALLQKDLTTPLCLDESILNQADAATAIRLGSCSILNIKQGRVGGLLESLRIARFAAEKKIDVWSGGMDETGLGRALNIHLQADPEFTLPGDTSETSRYFAEDIIDTPVVLDSEGYIAMPSGPGLGVQVVPERLEKYTIGWEVVARA